MLLVSMTVLSACVAAGRPLRGNPHVERVGNAFRTERVGGGEDCSALCARDGRCESWSWRRCDGKCSLMASSAVRAWAAGGCTGESGTAAQLASAPQYTTVPLGWTAATGWLLNQLKIQADGQAGHLDLFWPDVMDSVWVGGTEDHAGAGHERGPYWLNGMVPCVAFLNASAAVEEPQAAEYLLQGLPAKLPHGTHTTAKRLHAASKRASVLAESVSDQVEKYVWYVVDHQLPNGWLGPDDGFGGAGNDYWSGWNMAVSLLQYADAHSGTAVAEACQTSVFRYLNVTYSRMLTTPLQSWSQVRYQDLVYIAQMLYDQNPLGQEQVLVDLMSLATEQGWSWNDYFNGYGRVTKFYPLMPNTDWNLFDHGVNNAMGTKAGAVGVRLGEGGRVNQSDFENMLHMQMKYHGQPHGVFSADECYGGRNLTRGIELCAVVEQMYSLEVSFHQFGDVKILDLAERISFNALPATLTPDMWQHQYLQQANEILAAYSVTPHVWWTDGDDSTGFGVEPNFGCCTANHPQGWPKFANNVLLMYTSTDGLPGIALAMYGPVSSTMKAGPLSGTQVNVVTEYPFGDNVNVTVTVPGNVQSMPFRVRVPGWATSAVLKVNGAVQPAKAGTMNEFVLKPGVTKFDLELNPEIRVEMGWGHGTTNAASVVRGPLLFSHGLEERTSVVKVWAPFNNTNVNITSDSVWNHALSFDPLNVAASFSFHRPGTPGALPFNISGYPVYITAKVVLLPSWMKRPDVMGAADEPAASPIFCKGNECGAEFEMNLVPYGATDLRIAAFPWVCTSANALSCFQGEHVSSKDTMLTVDYGSVDYGPFTSNLLGNDTMLFRTGDPGQKTMITVAPMIMDANKTLDAITIAYSYQTGYPGSSPGASFVVSLVNILTNATTVAYTSPVLTDYPYKIGGEFSPLVKSTAQINLAVTQPHRIVFHFDNGGRNLNIMTPVFFEMGWSS
ncbi:hypothetical protein DIPPA_18533 [Diplonema papillatum]|nr:hypothetical protein DIPPA_18533 [Diplonema papillatum]